MARLMPSWRSLPQTGTVSGCAGDTARFAITCSPSSTIPRWQPTTTEANGNCTPPQPIARSPAASVPTGAPTCSPPSAPLSELPHAEASTPIRPFARPYAGSPFSNRVEQIQSLADRYLREGMMKGEKEALVADALKKLSSASGYGSHGAVIDHR